VLGKVIQASFLTAMSAKIYAKIADGLFLLSTLMRLSSVFSAFNFRQRIGKAKVGK